jgi:uncharacterized protein (TIGR02271 family)
MGTSRLLMLRRNDVDLNYSGSTRDDQYYGRSLVGVFADRSAAHTAIQTLHDEGFHHTWLGVTAASGTEGITASPGTAPTSGTLVTSDDEEQGGFLGAVGRFFSGESGTKSLYDELTRHGVSAAAARQLDGSLPPNSAILTVDGHNHPELAAQIVEGAGGHIVAGESFASTDDPRATMRSEYDRGSEALGYESPDAMARGQAIDEARRLQLREERLDIAKRQTQSTAEVGKEVVTYQESQTVPLVREELFIEQRPVSSETSASDGTPIGSDTKGAVLRIPLMREELQVSKKQIVTGEVLVGKRQVVEDRKIEETLREERLVNKTVSDPSATTTESGAVTETPHATVVDKTEKQP